MTLTYLFNYDKKSKDFEASIIDTMGMGVYYFSLGEMLELLDNEMIQDVDDLSGLEIYLREEGIMCPQDILIMGTHE